MGKLWIPCLISLVAQLPQNTLAACTATFCPTEFPTKLGDYCYRLERNRIANYDASSKYCKSLHGQMPQFKSKAEYDTFISWWSTEAQKPTIIALGTNSFIGLKSDTVGGTKEAAKWHWDNTPNTDTKFTDWYKGTDLRPVPQPEKECGTCDCVRLRYDAGPPGGNGYWFDTNCYRMDCSSLCQFDLSTYCPVPTLDHGTVEVASIPVKKNDVIKLSCHKCCKIKGDASLKCKSGSCKSYEGTIPTCDCSSVKCPNGWTAAGMFCYQKVRGLKNFADAEAACKAANSASRLPEFQSEMDYKEFIPVWTNMMQRLPIWVGLERKVKTSSTWLWSSSGKQPSYRPDWYSPLSNDYYLCTAMVNVPDGRLVSDYPCSTGLSVLCQLDCQQ